jgi:capsular polysaccharide transport system permease protein
MPGSTRSWIPALPLQARVRPPIRWEDVVTAQQTQARVIWALMLRETISRYGEYKIGFLWAFIEPLLTVLVFVLIFSAMRSDSPGGMPLIPFMLTGIVSFTLFKDPWTQMQNGISTNKSLLAFPQVTTFDVLIARALMAISISLFVLAFMLGMAHLLGYESDIESPLGVLAIIGLMCIMGVGLGFLFAALEPIMPSVKQVSSLIMGRPLFLGSGLFFIADTIPVQVREYVLYNPLLHCMELLRTEYFHEFHSAHGSWSYVSAWAFGSLAVGLAAHRGLRRKAFNS